MHSLAHSLSHLTRRSSRAFLVARLPGNERPTTAIIVALSLGVLQQRTWMLLRWEGRGSGDGTSCRRRDDESENLRKQDQAAVPSRDLANRLPIEERNFASCVKTSPSFLASATAVHFSR